jgi:membrane-bound lytic murein transglycosylase B
MNRNKITLARVTLLIVAFGGTGCSPQEVKNDTDIVTVIPAIKPSDAPSNKPVELTKIEKKNASILIAEQKQRQQQLRSKPKQRYAQQTNKSPRIRKVPWVSSRPYTLAGDFSHNSSAKAFIKSMSRSSGMNSNYLNRLFSQARDLRKNYIPPKKTQRRYGKKGRWTRYRNFFLTPKHINGGVNFWRKNAATLNRAYQRYGVPPEYIVGILGVETIYGGNIGKTRVLDSLSTKAFRSGRRQTFFRNELRKFLLMAKNEGLNPTSLVGSSAGAIGLCQFMPSNFKPFGIDFDRSGSCNLWDPKDAIGSVANYFKKHNWRKGAPVLVRASTTGNGYKSMTTSYKKKYSLSHLARKGIRPQGRMDNKVRFLRMSTYAGDEIWLGGHNFYVITRYNHDSRYALAVHQLAQEVKRRYRGGR